MGCTQRSTLKQEFHTMKSGGDSITILFPHVEYSEKSGESKTAKTGYSVFVSRKVADVLKELIDKRHFISNSASVLLDSSIADGWFPRNYFNSVQQYKRICDSLMKSSAEKKYFPVASNLQELIDKVSTKYFVFVSGVVFGTTEETKRYDMVQAQTFKLFYDRPFVYDYQWSGLRLQIWVMEKASKEIVWYNYNDSRDTQYDPIRDREIEMLCEKLLEGK
jgi:hypothetical protein